MATYPCVLQAKKENVPTLNPCAGIVTVFLEQWLGACSLSL